MRKTWRWFLIIFLSFIGASAVLPLSYAKESSVELFADRAGRYVLEGRIAPRWIAAPPRRVDVTVVGDAVKAERGKNVVTQSLAFSKPSFEIREYPVINYPLGKNSALELDLELKQEGGGRAALRMGDPALFPDMLAQQFDFRVASFIPKNLTYKLKRKLGLKGDGSWRYIGMGASIKSIAEGQVLGTFNPKGEIVIQKDLAGIDLATSPWFRYEYELPTDDLPWLMQFEIKIKRGLTPGVLRIASKPIRGGGKQTITVNLLDMLRQAEPRAKGGKLEELIIHFAQESETGGASDVKIGLGNIAFYNQSIPASKGKIPAHLVAVSAGEVDITNMTGDVSASSVMAGRLLSRDSGGVELSAFPPIKFSASYQEQLPALFVGHAEYLDGLSAQDLDAVLDQKMFLEKRVLWQRGADQPVYLGSTETLTTAGETTIAKYAPKVRIDSDAYIKADFTLEGKQNRRVYLVVRGRNRSGGTVELERLVNPGELIRIPGIDLNNLEFVTRPQLSAASGTGFFQMTNIELSSYTKSTFYQGRPSEAFLTLDGMPIAGGGTLWKATTSSLPLYFAKTSDLNLIKVFPVNSDFKTGALLRLALQKPNDPDLELFLKIEGENESGGQVERLYPITRGRFNKLVNGAITQLSIWGRSPNSALYGKESSASLGLELLAMEDLGNPQGFAPLSPRFAISRIFPVDYSAAELAVTPLMNRIDTTLSLEEIWSGGKKVILPAQYLGGGPHMFNYHSEHGITLELKELQTLEEYTASRAGWPASLAPHSPQLKNSLTKLALFSAGIVVIIFLWRRWGPRFTRALHQALSHSLVFFTSQSILWITGIYLTFFARDLNAASWGGVALVLAYSLAVRYKLRGYFADKWPLFAHKSSAPYFVMALVMLSGTALMLVLQQSFLAEVFAVMVYYLLVLGVIVEFIAFSRESAKSESNL